MLHKFVGTVLLLSVVSTSVFAAGFKKGDVLYCEKEGIQATFMEDVGVRGAAILLDLGDHEVRHTQAQLNSNGSMLLMGASDCPGEDQCWEISLTVRAADIEKNKQIRTLISTKFNRDKTKYNTATCVVK